MLWIIYGGIQVKNMDGMLAISGMVILTCLSIVLLEQSHKGRAWIHLNLENSRSLVFANVIVYISLVQALMIPVLDINELLFSDTHLTFTIVGILPTIGWGIFFTQIVQGRESSHQKNIDGIAHLIALKAMKSGTPERTLLELIQSEKDSGKLTEQGVNELINLIGNRTDLIGAYARKMSESTSL
jgi:hypothetical protein